MHLFVKNIWLILQELAPSLFLGMLIAGLVHACIPKGFIRRALSRKKISSIIKAVCIGVPLPLCSCGVVPAAIGLNKDGASKGATTGFLISTPQTGVDSILVSANFLGWPFALFKILTALISGFIGAWIVDLKNNDKPANKNLVVEALDTNSNISTASRLKIALDYGFFEIFGSIVWWLLFGILASGLISTLIPQGYLHSLKGLNGLYAMGAMLAISLPLYVCTTASVPIAASLVAAGLPLGSAMVFLLAGPATNLATMGAIRHKLGNRVLVVYLAVITVMSISSGLMFDRVLNLTTNSALNHVHSNIFTQLMGGALILLFLFFMFQYLSSKIPIKGNAKGNANTKTRLINIEGMTCNNCVRHVKNTLEDLPEIELAEPDFKSGEVQLRLRGEVGKKNVENAITTAGYTLTKF